MDIRCSLQIVTMLVFVSLASSYQTHANAPSYDSTEENGGRAFQHAFHVFQAGQYQEAATLFHTFLSTCPNHLLADYALFYQAAGRLKTADYSTARTLFRQLHKAYPLSRLLEDAAFLEADTWFFQGRYAHAITTYRNLKNRRQYKKHPRRPELFIKLAQAYEAQKQFTAALAIYHQARLLYPANVVYDQAKRAEERIAAQHPAAQKFYTAKRLLKSIDDLVRAGKAHDALPFLQMVKTFSLSPAIQMQAALKEAYIYYVLRDNIRAKAQYRQFLRDSPHSKFVPSVLDRIGRIYLRQGNFPAFLTVCDRLLRQYPKDQYTAAAMRLKGKEFALQGNYQAALKEFTAFQTQFPKSPLISDILWNLGWSQYQLGEYQHALSTFARLIKKYPKSYHKEEARYWAGRAAEQVNRLAEAAQYYRQNIQDAKNSYFGKQSQQALIRIFARKPSLQKAQTQQNKPLEWDVPVKFLTKNGVLHQKKSDAFFKIGLYDLAGEELAYAIARDAKSHPQYRELARLYSRTGDYHNLFRVMHGHFREWVLFGDASLPQEFWKLAFPQSFPEIVNRHAASNGVDPYLVQSIMLAESAFDPHAFSPTGAMGLMQLMPATGKRLAAMVGMRLTPQNDFFRPEVNILLGTTYLKKLSQEFPSQLPPVIASYNAGEHRVHVWWKEEHHYDTPAFIAIIPYRETWKYVQKVLWYYREYHRIYGISG